jgi:hypothetical protein
MKDKGKLIDEMLAKAKACEDLAKADALESLVAAEANQRQARESALRWYAKACVWREAANLASK